MKSIIKIAIVLSSPLLAINPAFSQAPKVSSENLVQINEDAYWAAEVSCNDNSERTVQRRTNGSEWCGKEVSGFCANNKDAAAVKVCGPEYSSALSLKESSIKAKEDADQAKKRADRAERDREEQRRLSEQRLRQQQEEKARQAAAAAAPLKKQISIEEELILIEQEKLNLRRQELELQKRAVEIEKLLEKAT